MVAAVTISITGKVQGVGFRYHTMRKAIELGVCGYVTNLSDGSVQIQAEAEKNILEYFIDWCQCGPPNAVIEQIEIQTCDPSGLSGFVVK